MSLKPRSETWFGASTSISTTPLTSSSNLSRSSGTSSRTCKPNVTNRTQQLPSILKSSKMEWSEPNSDRREWTLWYRLWRSLTTWSPRVWILFLSTRRRTCWRRGKSWGKTCLRKKKPSWSLKTCESPSEREWQIWWILIVWLNARRLICCFNTEKVTRKLWIGEIKNLDIKWHLCGFVARKQISARIQLSCQQMTPICLSVFCCLFWGFSASFLMVPNPL